MVDCAIVGGGPSGLAAAIAMIKSSPSTSVAVYEEDVFQPKGASIRISPDGWTSLKKLDKSLIPKLKETSVRLTSVEIKPWTSEGPREDTERKGLRSRLKKKLSKVPKAVASRVLASRIRIHLWHDIRITLRDHAAETHKAKCLASNDVPFLNNNCRLTNIVELDDDRLEERFELTFRKVMDSGKEETMRVKTKYLIACDGVKSQVRSLLPKEPDTLLPQKNSVWRGLAPNADVQGRATFYKGAPNSENEGRLALSFPAGTNGGASWTVISDLKDGKADSMEEAKQRVLNAIKSMGESNPGLKAMIEDSNFVIESKLNVRNFDAPWGAAYDGLIYLGDAAHPVRPTGEGMALAFEDACVLAKVISESGNDGPSVEALRKFEKERYLPVKTLSEEILATNLEFRRSRTEENDTLLSKRSR